MSEQEGEVADKAPEVGPGSPAGWRWFVSSKYPHLVVTVVPAQDKTATSAPVKGVYFRLKTYAKPNAFMGDGKLGTENHSGTDKNDLPHWGIEKAYDPGPEPEDGYKDDGKEIPRAQRLTGKQKQLLRRQIDAIRGSFYYGKEVQDNQVDRLSQLKELDWDPTPLSGTIKGLVSHGKAKLGKSAAAEAQAAAAEAPAETHAAAAKPRVPTLSKPKKAVAA